MNDAWIRGLTMSAIVLLVPRNRRRHCIGGARRYRFSVQRAHGGACARESSLVRRSDSGIHHAAARGQVVDALQRGARMVDAHRRVCALPHRICRPGASARAGVPGAWITAPSPSFVAPRFSPRFGGSAAVESRAAPPGGGASRATGRRRRRSPWRAQRPVAGSPPT